MVSKRTIRRRRKRASKDTGIVESAMPIMFDELTKPGPLPWGGLNFGEVAKVDKVDPALIQHMIDMDGQARSLFNALRQPILRNAKKIEIEPPRIDEGQAETDFIRSVLKAPRHEGGMKTSFVQTTASQCMAFVSGFKTFENVYDRPGTIIDDGMIRVKYLKAHDPRTITFEVDDKGELSAVFQRINWKGRSINKKLDIDKFSLFALQEEETPYYGKSWFLPAYYHFDKKHKLYYILHLALSVGAIRPRVARARGAISDRDKKTFLDALSNLGANSALLLPDGFDLPKDQQIELGRGSLPYIDAIEHHDMQMARSMLMQFLNIGSGSSGGAGFSMSKNHLDFASFTLEGVMDDMADMWNNKVIPELITWNFGTRNFPRVKFPPFTDEIRDMMADSFNKIIGVRETPLSPEFITEMERKMAEEFDLDITPQQHDEQKARLIAKTEMEQAMEEANVAIAEDTLNKPTEELLRSPEFIHFAVQVADRYQKKLAAAGIAD